MPIIGHGSLVDAVVMAKSVLKSTFGDFMAEGIVVRPTVSLYTRSGNRIIGKIKTKDF